jgi:hypothetical protein
MKNIIFIILACTSLIFPVKTFSMLRNLLIKTTEQLEVAKQFRIEEIIKTRFSKDSEKSNNSLKSSPALVLIDEIRSENIASRCREINCITDKDEAEILEGFFNTYKDNESLLIKIKIKGISTPFSISDKNPEEFKANFDRFLSHKNIEGITVIAEKTKNPNPKDIVTFKFWNLSTSGLDLIWHLLREYLIPKRNQ